MANQCMLSIPPTPTDRATLTVILPLIPYALQPLPVILLNSLAFPPPLHLDLTTSSSFLQIFLSLPLFISLACLSLGPCGSLQSSSLSYVPNPLQLHRSITYLELYLFVGVIKSATGLRHRRFRPPTNLFQIYIEYHRHQLLVNHRLLTYS